MCLYFKKETDAAQNLIDDFFLTLAVRRPFHRKDFIKTPETLRSTKS